MRTRFVVFAGTFIGIGLMGCSRKHTAKVAASPTATPQRSPATPTPIIDSPPVQFGPPPGAKTAGPPRQNFGPQPVKVPLAVNELANRPLAGASPEEREKIRYFTHLRETVRLFNRTLAPIDAATNLNAADISTADKAVRAFVTQVQNPPVVPASCDGLNQDLEQAAEELGQIPGFLRGAKSGTVPNFDGAMMYLDTAEELMKQAVSRAALMAPKPEGQNSTEKD